MGFLIEATPLDWTESKKWLAYVREHGIEQFLQVYHSTKCYSGDRLKYGDELEYHIVKLDRAARKVRISLRGRELLALLDERERDNARADKRYEACTWHPEFGSWMIEATPAAPYGGYTSDLRRIEKNMRLRRARLCSVLGEDEFPVSMVAFPLMGTEDFTSPAFSPDGPIARSDGIPDEAINPHPRFGALVRNIRERRQAKVSCISPIFQDTATPPGETEIEMDCMAYGMGMCCLQVTFQARDVTESRHLYDQLAVLAPIMLALTAATPIMKGRLLDTDVRWRTIAQSVDDRTPAERGVPSAESTAAMGDTTNMAGRGEQRIFKSRYDSISTFICNCGGESCPQEKRTSRFNDVPCPVDEALQAKLEANGIDSLLARHIAHLFVRDPLVVMKERVHLDDKTEVDHWENLQSTNWQTVRFKPPPEIAVREDGAGASTAACADAASRDTASASASASVSPIGGESSGSGSSSPSGASSKAPDDGHIGWRTEFRPMEVQLTDFENAAFTVFIALVSRVILAFELNLYVPMSKVDENMERAHTRNAVLEQKFFFRNHMDGEPDRSACSCADGSAECSVHNHADSISEFTVLEILTGKGSYFPGLVPLCKFYLDEIECDAATKKACYAYFELLIERANGDIMTAAAWQRHFVTTHPAYRQDSVVSQEIAFDLVKTCHEVAMGKKHIPELLGAHTIRPIDISNAFPHKPLKGRSSSAGGSRPAHMDAVIGRYAARAQRKAMKRKLAREIVEKESELQALRKKLRTVEASAPRDRADSIAVGGYDVAEDDHD